MLKVVIIMISLFGTYIRNELMLVFFKKTFRMGGIGGRDRIGVEVACSFISE